MSETGGRTFQRDDRKWSHNLLVPPRKLCLGEVSFSEGSRALNLPLVRDSFLTGVVSHQMASGQQFPKFTSWQNPGKRRVESWSLKLKRLLENQVMRYQGSLLPVL